VKGLYTTKIFSFLQEINFAFALTKAETLLSGNAAEVYLPEIETERSIRRMSFHAKPSFYAYYSRSLDTLQCSENVHHKRRTSQTLLTPGNGTLSSRLVMSSSHEAKNPITFHTRIIVWNLQLPRCQCKFTVLYNQHYWRSGHPPRAHKLIYSMTACLR